MGRCKARLHTQNGEVIKQLNDHSHDSSSVGVEVATVITTIKRRAESTVENTVQVINQCIGNLSQAGQAAIPNTAALRKVIRRKRNEIHNAPLDPAVLGDLVIPDAYKVYRSEGAVEENFLLHDSGRNDNNRILIFGRETWIQYLQSAQTWFVDGTFSIAPRLFAQVYVIMAKKLGGVHPILYALLPNKQRATYVQMFEAIKNLSPNLHPNSVSCDFESAAISAISECFPDTAIRGCFFHLAKNMKKHLTDMGFVALYNNDAEFALKAKMVISLVFVPLDDLDGFVEELGQELPQELQPLLDWFEDNYMGRLNRRGNGRRRPLFPPETWNLYDRVLNDQDRTNNHVEAAHRRIQTELGVHHPTTWKFIDGLRKVQKNRDTYYEQLVAGNSAPPKLRKYRMADERIKSIVSQYHIRDKIEYLRGLAHNYQF
ncbi:uncharacterized protein LOC116170185 [Photinus pyralis]|uniref:uncharacterized protein LOC116170185 n=1 Tax=Photinus pyralis TaxID=7054 RepID=UPI0012677523|nr:uncharacterized protein LOC116170185 [Photinus pyralis]